MSILTNDEKGSQINGVEISNNFKYIRDVLADAGLGLKDYEAIEGDVWKLDSGSNFKKLELTGDKNLFTEGGKSTRVYILDVKQPANGEKKLTIDGHPILLHPFGVTKVIVTQGAFGKEYDSTFTNAELAPRILSESDSITTIKGGLVQFYVRGYRIKTVYVYKDGDPIEEKESPSFQFRMNDEKDEGSYQFKLENEYGFVWSKEMFAVMAEAEPAQIILQPVSASVEAGSSATLVTDVAGAPSPQIVWYEVKDGKDIPTGVTGKEFTVNVLYTKTYVPIATNRYKVEVEVPAVLAEDGETVITPATTKLEYKTFTDRGIPATLTPIKQEQAAPTNPITNDNEDFYDWDNPANVTDNKQLEETLDGGVTYGPLSDKPIKVGDVDIAGGKIGVRVAETLTHNASETLYNGAPFTPLVKAFTSFIPSERWSANANTIMVQPAWGVGSTKVLPRTPGAYVEAIVRFKSGTVSPPVLVLDETSAAENTEGNQKFGLGGLAPGGSGYEPVAGLAVLHKIVEGVSSDSETFDFTDGDKVRFEVINEAGVIKLAMKHYHAGAWTIDTVVAYPVALFIKVVGGYSDSSGTLTIVYSGFNIT